MKILILSILLSLSWGVTQAQVLPKNSANPEPLSNYRGFQKSNYQRQYNRINLADSVYTYKSTGAYKAFGNANNPATNFQISNPLIKAFNEKAANGNDVKISNSGIVGMPKITYGIVNGKLLLMNRDATTSGTMTGTGSVGTGSSLGNAGTSGNAIGVNGKSPYDGSGIYSLPLNDERKGAEPQNATGNVKDKKKQ